MKEIDDAIERAIKNFDGKVELEHPFENLVSLGEIVDRLSICNFKLFKLKDEVTKRQDAAQYLPESEKTAANEFCSWASVEDVKLCRERSRLKNCIDKKVIAMIARALACDELTESNPETKIYGNSIYIDKVELYMTKRKIFSQELENYFYKCDINLLISITSDLINILFEDDNNVRSIWQEIAKDGKSRMLDEMRRCKNYIPGQIDLVRNIYNYFTYKYGLEDGSELFYFTIRKQLNS